MMDARNEINSLSSMLRDLFPIQSVVALASVLVVGAVLILPGPRAEQSQHASDTSVGVPITDCVAEAEQLGAAGINLSAKNHIYPGCEAASSLVAGLEQPRGPR